MRDKFEDVKIRLEALEKKMADVRMEQADGRCIREAGKDVNNHVHTFYSFSPYSPSEAVFKAYEAGLCAVGLIDHDTVAGAYEFIEAGKLAGIGTTVGLECRADFSMTRLSGKRINNPDQLSIAYVVLHGIPHSQLDRVTEFMKPYSDHRNTRNREMTARLNAILNPYSVSVDYDEDVVPYSRYNYGGTITERHLLFVLALKIIDTFGAGGRLINFLKYSLDLEMDTGAERILNDTNNPYYVYDLLGILKSQFLPRIYVPASLECPAIEVLSTFAKDIGCILAYPYLGDVRGSVTNDKKDQTFEDPFIDLLFEEIKSLGFRAVTYMPSRNTREQLLRVMFLCEKFGLMQISGEDINSPKQSFICMKQRENDFAHLYDTTWALIGHELAASRDLKSGMFTEDTILKYPDLHSRIKVFKDFSLSIFKKSF